MLLKQLRAHIDLRQNVLFMTCFVVLIWDVFDFDIVNFPLLDCDAPCSTCYGVYISQLIRAARVPRHGDGFNTRNIVLTAELLRQGCRYHKLSC